jgi:capsular exopolysaccharide synthesis family protein
VASELVDAPTNATEFGFARTMLANPDVADAYDALLCDLRLAGQFTYGSSILVTSAAPGEGKTTISLCLGITASTAGQKVLLIDGDLRRSSLTMAIGGADTLGLIDFILGEAEATEAVRPVPAFAEMPGAGVVSFMGGGRKPPTVLAAVDWSTARTAFKSMAQAFGIVFLDSPPILAANDALLLAGIVDAVLLVVGTGKSYLHEIRKAKAQLDAIGTPIAGVVLNGFTSKVHGPSNRPYSGYYSRTRI